MPGVAARWAGWAGRMRNVPGPLATGEPLPVTYPTALLVTKVEIALGADLTQPWQTWVWEDITRFVRHADGITVTTGKQDESSLVQPGKATMRLDNRDGRFSRHNPAGPYFGLLSKNTPIRAAIDPGSGFVNRLEMFVTEWPTRSDRSQTDVTVPIVCAGILRRLGQNKVKRSALRRTMALSGAAGYWPMEDGLAATVAASGLLGGPSMAVTGSVDFATIDGPPGSGPLCDGLVDDLGSLLVPDVLAASDSSWTMSFIFRPGDSASGLLLAWSNPASPTYGLHTMHFSAEGDTLQVTRYDGIGGQPTTAGSFNVLTEEYNHLIWQQQQNGASVEWFLYINGVLDNSGSYTDTSGPPRSMAVTPYLPNLFVGGLGPVSFGHFALWSGIFDARDHYATMLGNVGEFAHDRIARLCEEDGITYTPSASSSPRMGAQRVDTLLNLLRQAEAVDGGVLYERSFGLGYQSRAERHNATVALTMDFAEGHVSDDPEHPDDDQLVRNRWTVKRIDGSEATVEDADSIAADQAYEDEAELALYDDAQCKHQASWRVHEGTVDEERWPRLDINFASTGGRDLIPAWLALPFGSRMNANNPPDTYVADPVDAFIEGIQEHWNPIDWDAVMFTKPAAPFSVHVVGDTTGNRGRVDNVNSTLFAAATDVATSLSVASAGALWRTGAVTFDLDIAGERVTVTNIANTSTVEDTFGRTESNGWGTTDTGHVYAIVPASGAVSNFSVTTSPFGQGRIQPSVNSDEQYALIDTGSADHDITADVFISATPASGTLRIGLSGRYLDANNEYHAEAQVAVGGAVTLRIMKRAGGTAAVLTTLATGITLVADTKYTLRFQVIGDALRAKFWLAVSSEPADWMSQAIDTTVPAGNWAGAFVRNDSAATTQIFKWDDLRIDFHQTFTVTRSVNGVVKAQAAGTKVRLWKPGVYAL